MAITTQGTDYQIGGQNLNVNNGNITGYTPTPISTSALSTPQTPLNIPPIADTTGLHTSAILDSASSTNTDVTNAQTGVDAATKGYQKIGDAYTTLLEKSQGKAADTQQAYNQTGATDLLNQVNDYKTQIDNLARESTAIPLQTGAAYQGSSGTQAGVASVNRDLLQRNALQALTVAQASAVSQGKYDRAKQLADQYVTNKYAGDEAKLKAMEMQMAITDKLKLTPAQEKLKEATKAKTEKLKQDLAEKKAAEKAVSDMLIEASPVAPPDVMARATKIKNEGGSAVQVAQALGKYGGDFLKNELLKEQIKTQVSNRTTDELQRKKLQAEINSINTKTSNLTPQPTGKVTAPNGDAIGLPNETLSAIGRLKLNEGQANAVAFTSRMIQSNQALDKQLGTINPKGGFYETTGYDPTSAGSAIGRFTGSDQSRVYITNSSDFIRAKLRKESGATISPEEMSADAAIYTPSGAGLDEKDLLLAKTKRDEAIKSMIAQAGPAAPYLQQYYEQAKTQGETFTSENPQLNDWYKNTTNAVNTSTAQATTGAASYGFVDNITK